MKLITYNVWHGLNGSGILKFGELEPAGRRTERIHYQLRNLQQLDPDILFLQEMNPVMELSRQFARVLGMSVVSQIDQTGIKILEGGFPSNLQSGLSILAKRKWNLKKVGGIKLSGRRGFVSPFLSLQL